jgi:hypothetical protein
VNFLNDVKPAGRFQAKRSVPFNASLPAGSEDSRVFTLL